MATIATTEEIADRRSLVKEYEDLVVNTRYQLSYAAEDDDIDRLAAELTRARDDLRRAKNILGDMEAGAGDFHDWDADTDD